MNNLRGIALIILSMAAFATEDMFVKALTTGLSVGQVMFMLGLGGALCFAAAALYQSQALFTPLLRSPMLLLRTVSEGFAAFFFVTALSNTDMSTVAALFQATPLAITLGAALFLSEKVGWRRWAAILVGFAGVLVIIRPGLEGFQPSTLLVLGTVAAIATRDLVSRRLPRDMSSVVVSFHGFGALVIVGAALILLGPAAPQGLNAAQSGQVLGAVVFGVLGYYAIVIATRTGDASVITPFRYTRLIFSMLLGMVVFAERPDLWTYVGSGLIIGSGLYAVLRERRLSARSRR
ncbi:DMT family transporter [Thalassovita sp.]|jgi:drug/metabolite transporter (DMT)-like permease|uniref:DMT family transporter n=1 Tax=Thalassovita sp. TaxID=1979401 RepID=UPI003B5A36FA